MLYMVLHDDAVTVWLSHKGGIVSSVDPPEVIKVWVVGLV